MIRLITNLMWMALGKPETPHNYPLVMPCENITLNVTEHPVIDYHGEFMYNIEDYERDCLNSDGYIDYIKGNIVSDIANRIIKDKVIEFTTDNSTMSPYEGLMVGKVSLIDKRGKL